MNTLVLSVFGRTGRLAAAAVLLGSAAAALAGGASPALTTLYSFTGGENGANPSATVIFGGGSNSGNLFGTTYYGGTQGYGTVFELTPGAGSSWIQTVIYNFRGGTDGENPGAALVVGGKSLYGTTFQGGSTGNGTVFELSPPAKTGGPWTETVLYSFQTTTGCPNSPCDGSGPEGAITWPGDGTIYGTTSGGGNSGAGTVFQLNPPISGTGPWTEAILYNFQGGKDGSGPQSGVITYKGDLYGTTCCGTEGGLAFRLAASKSGVWSKDLLFNFSKPSLGSHPYGELAVDSNGVFYGTTSEGGTYGGGTVFSLTSAGKGKPYTLTTIHDFTNGADGGAPYANVTLGTGGVLYTTATSGCAFEAGCVLEFTPPTSGSGPWTETILYSFMGANDGSEPFGGVTLSNNTLYGTTNVGGVADDGTVFSLVP